MYAFNFLLLSAALFSIGVFGVIARKTAGGVARRAPPGPGGVGGCGAPPSD